MKLVKWQPPKVNYIFEILNLHHRFSIYLDVWLLTTGLNSGVSKLIGSWVHRHKLLSGRRLLADCELLSERELLVKSAWKPVLIGMSSWGTISEDSRKLLKEKVFKRVELFL